MNISPLAGKPVTPDMLVNVPRLITAYYNTIPDYTEPAQRIAFGTSGHRGSSFDKSFNEWHILAITQAICDYRKQHKVEGPLFLGIDTHALSEPAMQTAVEVLVANGVNVMLATGDEYTPTPAISYAILTYNSGRREGLADGIVITPSHNPPNDGGFKYNPINGGPAESEITNWIENRANALLKNTVKEVKRTFFENAIRSPLIHRYDYLNTYVNDLGSIIDMDAIRNSGIKLGVDPLGGAGVHYWEPIAERYKLNLTVANKEVDPTFRFMTVDWDGKIRMDPSSPYAMQGLIKLRNQFDICFACDTDHDRHGIVTKSAKLLPPNHFLSVAILYLFQNRTQWDKNVAIGKTVVSSSMIDKVAGRLNRTLYEVPVGFKWFAEGLFDGSLGFGGEESAGAIFLRRNGGVWTTDKDGLVPALLSAEITAVMNRYPDEIYTELEAQYGKSYYQRIDAPATTEQKKALAALSPSQITVKQLAGENIVSVLSNAPGNKAPIGGIKVITEDGWFAARPSGTEEIYKIYAESFRSAEQLSLIIAEAQRVVDATLRGQPAN